MTIPDYYETRHRKLTVSEAMFKKLRGLKVDGAKTVMIHNNGVMFGCLSVDFPDGHRMTFDIQLICRASSMVDKNGKVVREVRK